MPDKSRCTSLVLFRMNFLSPLVVSITFFFYLGTVTGIGTDVIAKFKFSKPVFFDKALKSLTTCFSRSSFQLMSNFLKKAGTAVIISHKTLNPYSPKLY